MSNLQCNQFSPLLSNLHSPSSNVVFMTRFLLPFLLLMFLYSLSAPGQSLYFPPLVGSTWESRTPASLGWDESKIPPLIEFLRGTNTKAFLVLKDGRIVIEQYFDAFTKDSLWYWASAGKSLTAVLVGLARQEGLLSLDDRSSLTLGRGWTSLPAAREDRITVWHHLTMTTGLDDGAGDPDCTLPSCLVFKADPGTRWAYHNAPYTLLDGVIEGATKMTLNQWYQTRLRNRIGMNGLYVKSGSYNNLLVTAPRSMARFGLLILNRGTWDGTPILTDTAYFRAMTMPSQTLNASYGFLWWLNGYATHMMPQTQWVFQGPLSPDAPADAIMALGKNGQILHVVPHLGLVVVRMGNDPSDAGLIPSQLSTEIWKRLNPVLGQTTDAEHLAAPRDLDVTLSPNPAHETVTLRWTATSPAPTRVSLHDALGRTLQEYPIPPTSVMGMTTLSLPHSGASRMLFVRIECDHRIRILPLLLR